MNDITYFDPAVIEDCRKHIDGFLEKTCEHFTEAVGKILACANVHDLNSIAALCERLGLDAAWSDNRPLLVITPHDKPAFIQGEPTASPETAAPAQLAASNVEFSLED